MEDKIWHSLRDKPDVWEYLLVETTTKHYPYRICLVTDGGYWKDAYKTSYYFPKGTNKYGLDNDFKPKRWLYLKDIANCI